MPESASNTVEQLSEVLISQSLISEKDAIKYENTAKKEGVSLYQYLFMNSIIPEIDIIFALSNYYKYNYINVDCYDIQYLPQIIDSNWIEKNRIIPLKTNGDKNNQTLCIALSDLTEIERIEKEAKVIYKCKYVMFLLSEETKINNFIENNLIKRVKKEENKRIISPTAKPREEIIVQPVSNSEIKIENKSDNDKPLNDFIQKILLDAINSNVSDIHFEPYENYYRVRFRQNGEMYDTSIPPAYINEKLTKKLKNIAKMEVDNNSPQLGRINLQFFGGRDVDFRASSFPTSFGEKIVLQIQDSQNIDIGLAGLGFSEESVENIENILVNRKKGLNIFAGKPRSGKTLTAYNCIKILNPQKFNVYSIEKISTLKVKGINQTLLNPNGQPSSLDILKQLQYQDTDAVLFEETKNKEELRELINLSNKGNVILTTINSDSLRETINMLRKKGMSVNEIVNEINLISYQIMFKKLCEDCKVKETWSKIPLMNIGFNAEDLESYNLTWATYNSIGCQACNHRKIKGSTVSFQTLFITEKIRQLIYSHAEKNEDELMDILLTYINDDIKYNVIEKIKKGEISYQEGESILDMYKKK